MAVLAIDKIGQQTDSHSLVMHLVEIIELFNLGFCY